MWKPIDLIGVTVSIKIPELPKIKEGSPCINQQPNNSSQYETNTGISGRLTSLAIVL
jgi:hypothetical protein